MLFLTKIKAFDFCTDNEIWADHISVAIEGKGIFIFFDMMMVSSLFTKPWLHLLDGHLQKAGIAPLLKGSHSPT
jgi:hypothetical protein